VLGELDQSARQQLQGPTSTTLGRSRAGCGDQQGFFFAGELTLGSWTRLLAQSRLRVAQHKAALGPVDSRKPKRENMGSRNGSAQEHARVSKARVIDCARQRQRYGEAVRTAVTLAVGDAPAMTFGDLPHEGEPQAGAASPLGRAAALERQE